MPEVPTSKEAEMAVIGCVLLNPACFREIDLSVDDFYYVDPKDTWSVFQQLTQEHKEIDIVTVADKDPKLANFAISVVNNTPSSLNWQSYVSIVKDKARRREYIQLASELATHSYNEDSDIQQRIPEFLTKLVSATSPDKESEHITKTLSILYDDIQDRAANPKDIYGLPTGIAGLDKITGGLQKGEVFLLSGEPGLGKSLLAMQIAFHMAKSGYPGVIYEMEMSRLQTLRRTLSVESGVQVSTMKSGKIGEQEALNINEAFTKLETLPMYFSDSTSWTTASLRADLVKRKTLNKIEFFILDYLRLLKDRYGKDDHERLAFIGSSLHDIAKDLNLCALVIHSQNKQGMSGNSGMASLSGSGQISYDVDAIAVMTKDPKYPNLINVMFDKLREGDGDSRLLKLAKKPGFPQFAEAELGQHANY